MTFSPKAIRRRRLAFLLIIFIIFASGVAFIATTFRENLIFFYAPSEIASKQILHQKKIRVGGLVVDGSIVNNTNTGMLTFKLTDGEAEILLEYQGIIPPLFREGQGIVAEGILQENKTFKASNLLTKHDENYMPPEVAKSLKDKNLWQHYEGNKQ